MAGLAPCFLLLVLGDLLAVGVSERSGLTCGGALILLELLTELPILLLQGGDCAARAWRCGAQRLNFLQPRLGKPVSVGGHDPLRPARSGHLLTDTTRRVARPLNTYPAGGGSVFWVSQGASRPSSSPMVAISGAISSSSNPNRVPAAANSSGRGREPPSARARR